MPPAELSDRERKVLEAVIRSYVETAEPAGSRMISKRFGLGVSPATIRNTMSDLEEKGYLYHPHTSAGRIPTDIAYRLYVDSLMHARPLPRAEAERISEDLSQGGVSAIEVILRKAAQSLSIVTQELGVALGPRLDNAVLQRLELVRVSNDRLLLVLTLQGGAVRSIFVEVDSRIAESAVTEVMVVLNERLSGLTLRTIRATLGERLRDSSASAGASELLNVFVQEGEVLFDVASTPGEEGVVLGQASVLAEQPEFATGEGMRRLLALTETRAQLGRCSGSGRRRPGSPSRSGTSTATPVWRTSRS
jgi:heat-inducible transcriptional repressor